MKSLAILFITYFLIFSTFPVYAFKSDKETDFLNNYRGDIDGKYKIGMTLIFYEDNNAVDGTYYYDRYLKDIKISGVVKDNKDIILYEYDIENKVSAIFEGKLIDESKIEGSWKKIGSERKRSLNLTWHNTTARIKGKGRYSVAGVKNDSIIENSAKSFWNSVVKDNKNLVLNHIHYPIKINFNDYSKVYENEKELIKEYDRIFTPSFKERITNTIPHNMFVNRNGVMLENGEVWFNENGKVFILNNMDLNSKVETDALNQLIISGSEENQKLYNNTENEILDFDLFDKKNAQQQFNIGLMYKKGSIFQQDYMEAEKWFKIAANNGNPNAQYLLAVMYSDGRGVNQNHVKALKWYKMAADQGNELAQLTLGVYYEDGIGVQKNLNEAAKWYRKAANQGNVQAQISLGLVYANGDGIEQNDIEAIKWFRKAAEQGDHEGQFLLGTMINRGRGIVRNNEEAARWFLLSAENGNSNAQTQLGFMYENGLGVNRNITEAVRLYIAAAEKGNAEAQYYLGLKYSEGKAVPKDEVEAAKWIKKAAIQGLDDAQHHLGFMYKFGIGMTANKEESLKWFEKAAEQGHSRSLLEIGLENLASGHSSASTNFSFPIDEEIEVPTCEDTNNECNPPLFSPHSKSPDGRYLLTVRDNGSVVLKDFYLKSDFILAPELDYSCGTIGCRDGQKRVSFTPNGKYAITTSSFRGGPTHVWETETWSKVLFNGYTPWGGYFQISSDSRYIAVVSHNWKSGLDLRLHDLNTFEVYDISSIVLENKISRSAGLNPTDWFNQISNDKPIYNFCFSNDNKKLIIKKSNTENFIYDISNHYLSFCSSNDKADRLNHFDSLKEKVVDEILKLNISETTDGEIYCCNYTDSSPELYIAYRLVEEFQKALLSNNRELIADYLSYPTAVKSKNGIVNLYEPVDLINNFEKIFNQSDIENIYNSDFDCVGCRGIMVGLGYIWFNFEGKIIAININ